MQTAQLSLFDFITAAVEAAKPAAPIAPMVSEPATAPETKHDTGFISAVQKYLAETEPLFFIFKNKTLDEIEAVDKIHAKKYSKGKQNSLYISLYWTAQTIALEKIYRELDERFLDDYSGKFWLRVKGELQEVRFNYAPSFNFKNPHRTTVPNPHIEFHTVKNSPLTNTGYKSHFINNVPFSAVRSMEEFIELIVKEHFKVKEEFLFSVENEK